MTQRDEQMVAEALADDFGLERVGLVSRDKIIAALSWRVERLLAANADQLFSMLYRLDILERKIKEAMAEETGIAQKIAVLIYERQLEKVISRKQNPANKPGDDLAW